MSVNDTAYTLEDLGWRQCSIVTGADIPELEKTINDYQEGDIYIVLPYSCAVVQMDFEKEPNIELFRVRRTEKKNKGLQFGRSPRLLQIEIQAEDGFFLAEGFIHDRFFIDHSIFSGLSPNSNLSLKERECVIVKNWFAKRYIRSVFPTAFNTRVWPALKVLIKCLKSNSDLDELLGVYVTLDPQYDELASIEDPYDVRVDFLVQESGLRSDDIMDVKDRFEMELKKCEGILLSRIELRSDSDILLSEYRDLVRLDDYDYISHRDGHNDPAIN